MQSASAFSSATAALGDAMILFAIATPDNWELSRANYFIVV